MSLSRSINIDLNHTLNIFLYLVAAKAAIFFRFLVQEFRVLPMLVV